MPRRAAHFVIAAAACALSLSACGIGTTMQRGGAALSEAAQRGFSGFVTCERQRSRQRMGLRGDPAACPPVE
jgi:predicted small secreted protein